MSERPPPTIMPSVNGGWEDVNPATGKSMGNEHALRNLCDYGAQQVATGKCDCLAIDCMPGEQDFVRRYMSETHPTVAYAFGSGRRVWSMIMEARRKEATDGLI